MQKVVGGYKDLAAARHAVHRLEGQVSIQDLVIVDTVNAFGRKPQPTPEQKTRWGSAVPQFLVAMTGSAENIARVTQLLL